MSVSTKQARKGFRPPSAIKEIGYFQTLRVVSKSFWILLGVFLEEFFWSNFLEQFFGSNVVGEILFGRILGGGYFGRNSLGGIT